MLGYRKTLGAAGEAIAARFLERQGYKILEENWTCPLGEIDLVAQDKDTLVFVEVKSRTTQEFGPPELGVTKAKQRKLTRLALVYKKSHRKWNACPLRFDVVAIRPEGPELIRDAFWSEEGHWTC